MKQHARMQAVALKTAHAEQLAEFKRQTAADLAQQKAEHAQAIVDLTAKATAEADELRRQLAVARREAAEVQTLRRTLYSVRHAGELLTAALKTP